jgi:hypothetical protein
MMSKKEEETYRKVSSLKHKSKSYWKKGKVDGSTINRRKADIFDGYESPIEKEAKASQPYK